MAEDWIERSLRGLSRHEPPKVPLESIFERWRFRRRRALVTGGLAAAAGFLALIFVLPAPEEPPVHLQLEVVDVTAAEVLGAGSDATPEEPGP